MNQWLLAGALAALAVGLRRRYLDRPTRPIYAKEFEGEIHRIGACHALVRRAHGKPRTSVVCRSYSARSASAPSSPSERASRVCIARSDGSS